LFVPLMSGIELLFIDGGTTLGLVAAGVAERFGFKQKKQDDKDLVSKPEEILELTRSLQEALEALRTQHTAIVNAWRSPLSLFTEADVEAATSKGVAAWAAPCVKKAQKLSEEAAECVDLGEVYVVQLTRARNDNQGLLREPVGTLVTKTQNLTERIQVHLPLVKGARRAFDDPSGEDQDELLASIVPDIKSSSSFGSTNTVQSNEDVAVLPMAIFRDRSRLGEFWRLQERGVKRLLNHQIIKLGLYRISDEEKDADQGSQDETRQIRSLLSDEDSDRWVHEMQNDTEQNTCGVSSADVPISPEGSATGISSASLSPIPVPISSQNCQDTLLPKSEQQQDAGLANADKFCNGPDEGKSS